MTRCTLSPREPKKPYGNDASKTRTSNVAFLVDADALRNLENNILSEVKGTLEYKVKFSDGSTIKYADADSIVSSPTPTTDS
jgi:hypothetical protein